MVDQAAPEAVKLPDPNAPRYADARAKMANLFFAIGREDSRNGYGAMADDLMCGDLMQVPTWIALGMLAEAASLPCKSGEGAGEANEQCADCGGYGEYFGHSRDCTEDNCALAGGIDDCDGQVFTCLFCDPPTLTPDATQAREAEGPDWRTDVEAAPRDGTRILLMWHDHDNLPPHIELGKYGSAVKGWCNTYGKAFSGEPTHWMALATFPAALNARGGA